jgi:predicted metal-dependent hydrolase
MNTAINLNGRKIAYELVRKSVKNINLRIRPDCSVSVSANETIPASVIEKFLRKKSDYILSAIDKYAYRAKYVPNEHSFVTGESFRYLGKELRLKLMQGKNEVKSDGVYLYLTVPDVENSESKSRQIARWYDARCRELFSQLIKELYPMFRKYGVVQPVLSLRDMSSRWGSCQPKRCVITLNKRLIEAPRNCIEYVIMHEFIHFLYLNHSKKFYDLLSTLMPDWRKRKGVLESGEYLHIQKGK